jgi:hypothetical protein
VSAARYAAESERQRANDGGGAQVSFIKRAQEAAAQAAEAARQTAAVANQKANDPETQEAVARSAREAVGMARKGVTTVIEKIDPSTLAELIVKATYLQELTNKALRQKGSPYRIGEIAISASIPPAVSFAIARLGDEEEMVGQIVSSTELVAEEAVDESELVLALDGTTVEDAAMQGERMPAEPEATREIPADEEQPQEEPPTGWVQPG